MTWCAQKTFARGTIIQIASREKKKKAQLMTQLHNTIADLEALHKTSTSADILKHLTSCHEELRQELRADYDTYFKRMKLSFYSQNNRAGKLLASQLKKRQARANLTHIKHHNTNTTFHNSKDIANAFKDYYESLYNLNIDPLTHQPTELDIDEFLQGIQPPSMDAPILQKLNAPITCTEVEAVIRSLPMHKSPGADGFSAEYYKAFSTLLAPKLTNAFNIAAFSGSFPQEMLQAVIVTLPKPGKDTSSPQNFRPISLLNSDLKIYTKVLANRLMETIPALISLDQVGFVKGRQASDGTRRMLNLLRLAETTQEPSTFLTLNAEKAFDRVHWGYLSKTLSKFGISGLIHSAIMSLYTNPTARVYSSSLLSDPFTLSNVTRQGCPLSPIIFSLVIEPLAEYI